MSMNRFCLSVSRLFCDRGSVEGAIKMIIAIGTKIDFVFLYLIYTLLIGKLAMATGHTMPINLHDLNNTNH